MKSYTATNSFLNDNFLLENKIAEKLFHEVASQCPIVDFHNHLPPEDIASNRQFEDLTEAWLEGDHYKWRAMRANGIDEYYISGDASNREKFKAWAKTVPYTLRNPLYHWTHLELKRYFNIEQILSEKNADYIFDQVNEKLRTSDYRTQGLLNMMNVHSLCTSDEPHATLEHHRILSKSNWDVKVYPTWRTDPLMNIDDTDGFNAYLDKLSTITNTSIATLENFIDVVQSRHEFFHQNNCTLADNGLNEFPDASFTTKKLRKIFSKIRAGKPINDKNKATFRSGILNTLCEMNYNKGWVQQFHVGAIRNNNAHALDQVGPNTGFDSIGSSQNISSIASFLGNLAKAEKLSPSILYNNNPSDNYAYATMVGNFQDNSQPCKMQFGAGWWFMDQKEGMEMQLNALSNVGLLRRFVGMVTDSRSFLSFPRHEYFRRILCNLIGKEIDAGLLPNDRELIDEMIKEICYKNALDYFGYSGKK